MEGERDRPCEHMNDLERCY